MLEIKKAGVVNEYWYDITEQMKELIGDVINSAQIRLLCLDTNITEFEADLMQELVSAKYMQFINDFNQNNNLNIDEHLLEISFTTGKTIRIQASEWLTIFKKQ